MNKNTNPVSYTPTLEYFLQRKGEECEAWSNLHLMCFRKFKKRETMFNLPIITITALIGFVSGVNLQYEYIHLILGGMSLYASLLKSYFSYLKISQKSENHRIAYIQYGQIANEIRVELALERSTRENANDMLDLIRVKMKNLFEITEIVDNSVIDKYLSKLGESNPFRTDILRWIRNERQAATENDEITIGRPPVFKLANRIESYVDINKKMVLNKDGRPNVGLTTVKIDGPSDESDSSRTTENQLDPLDSDSALENTNDAASGIVTGIMV